MEYEYKNEWKQLKKEGKIREAADVLRDEIALNLLRAHNYYSDFKYNLVKIFEIADLKYGKNINDVKIIDMKEFCELRNDLWGTEAMFSEMDYDGEEYKQEDKLKMYMKTQKKMIKLYNIKFK